MNLVAVLLVSTSCCLAIQDPSVREKWTVPKELDYFVCPAAVDEMIKAGGVADPAKIATIWQKFEEYSVALHALDEKATQGANQAGRDGMRALKEESDVQTRTSPEFQKRLAEMNRPVIEYLVDQRKSADALADALLSEIENLASSATVPSRRESARDTAVIACWREVLHSRATSKEVYPDFNFDVVMLAVLEESAKEGGEIWALAHDSSEQAQRGYEVFRDSVAGFRASYAEHLRKYLRLERTDLNKLNVRAANGITQGMRDYLTLRREYAISVRNLIDAVSGSLQAEGESAVRAWQVRAWQAATPHVIDCASWFEGTPDWIKSSTSLSDEARTSVSRAWDEYKRDMQALTVASGRAALDRYLAEVAMLLNQRDMSAADEEYVKSVARIWARNIKYAQDMRQVLGGQALEEFNSRLGAAPLDSRSRMDCLRDSQVALIVTRGWIPRAGDQ